MNTSISTGVRVRRKLFGILSGGALAVGSAAMIAPLAGAQPATTPDCSAAGVAGTVSTATASEGAYLVANPQTNAALTNIAPQQPASENAYRAFFEQNPQVQSELAAIYQPVNALNNECGVQIIPTPVAQAVWSETSAD